MTKLWLKVVSFGRSVLTATLLFHLVYVFFCLFHSHKPVLDIIIEKTSVFREMVLYLIIHYFFLNFYMVLAGYSLNERVTYLLCHLFNR